MSRRSGHVCQGCGAPLPAVAPGVVRTCTYCNLVADGSPGGLRGTAGRTTRHLAVFGVAAFASLGSAFAGWMALRSVSPAESQPSHARQSDAPSAGASTPTEDLPAPEDQTVKPAPPWIGPHLMLVPHDHGRKENVLVTWRPSEGGALAFAVLDAWSGKVVWERPFVGTQEPLPLRAVVGETLVAFTDDHQMLGLDPERGTTLWTRPFAFTPERLCAVPRIVGIEHAGGLERVTQATGEPVEGAGGRDCEPVYDSLSAAPNFVYVDGPKLDTWLSPGDHFVLRRGLAPHEGVARVLLGQYPGLQGPVSVGVLQGKRWLWRSSVRAESPTGPQFFREPRAAVRHQRVVVPYHDDGSLHLASFDLGTGRRQWDREIAAIGSQDDDVEVLQTLAGRVLVRVGSGALWSVESDRGDIVWSFASQ